MKRTQLAKALELACEFRDMSTPTIVARFRLSLSSPQNNTPAEPEATETATELASQASSVISRPLSTGAVMIAERGDALATW